MLTQSLAGLKGDDGERPVIAADCDHASHSPAMLSLNQATVFMISFPPNVLILMTAAILEKSK